MKFEPKVPTEPVLHVEMDLTKKQAAVLMFRIDESPMANDGNFIDDLYKGISSIFMDEEYQIYYDKFYAEYHE